MTIAFAVVTDGRADYLTRTLRSCEQHLPGFDPVIVDDSGNHAYTQWLRSQDYRVVRHTRRRGLGGAVRSAWGTLGDAQYLWHQEDDFTLTEAVELSKMIETLDNHPHLAQLVLKRQPWSEEEKAAGGQIEAAPWDYTEMRDGDASYCEHVRLFSFNPCLIRRDAIERCLSDPTCDMLERGVTDTLLAYGYSFAYWGGRGDAPRCHHIGERRSEGYRW